MEHIFAASERQQRLEFRRRQRFTVLHYIPIVTSDISDGDAFVREVLESLSRVLGDEQKEEW
ncbi:hypothetical protein [Ruminococcus albus]|uniref:hypothetical protein n=1 Tax=Ruminococcus albus TaxID=1264 RepID=UPI001160329F|nr:hypothetical protein [Ruminococcus albus]